MTEDEILSAKENFAKWGVPENRIFSEIMRARYLDYNLFSNPTNAEYGITIGDLYKNMKMTVEKMGEFKGDEDTYVDVYTLAMRVNPMDFAEGIKNVSQEMKDLILAVIEKVKSAGQTVLFAGADSYLYMLPQVFYHLSDKRIAVSVNSLEWKKKLSYLFPQGRIMLSDEFNDDSELYDYIFNIERDDLAHVEELQKHLSKDAILEVLTPLSMIVTENRKSLLVENRLASHKMLEEYYDVSLDNEELAFLKIRNKQVKNISFGEACLQNGTIEKYEALKVSTDTFIDAHDWNYDIYRYNGSVALQTLLAADVVDLDYTIRSEYTVLQPENTKAGIYQLLQSNAIIEDIGIRTDLAEKADVPDGKLLTLIKDGDLLLFPGAQKIHTAVVYHIYEDTYVPDEIIVIRTKGIYTAEYLKVYLEGPLGQLFIDTMRAGDKLLFQSSRLMRFPLPEATEKSITWITEKCRNAIDQLALAAKEWRNLKNEAVHVMTER